MTFLDETANPAPAPTIQGLDFDDQIDLTSSEPTQAVPPPPSWVERLTVMVTIFVLIHGLPIDWFKGRDGFLEEEGNLKLVAAQLGLMMIGVVRVAGWPNWLIRVFRLDLMVLVFPGLAFASAVWSADSFETFKQAIIFLVVTFYAAYLILRFSLSEILELMARVLAVGGLVNLAFVLAFPQFGIDAEGLWDGVFFQKNALGFSALLAVPILLVVGRSGPSWRHLYYLCIPIQIALLIGSQSKTMLVATVGSVVLLVIYRMFRGRRTLRGAVILALLAVSGFTVAFATANIGLLADWLGKDITLTGRVPLWEDLIPLAMAQPFFGYGYKATFGGYFSPVHEVWVAAGWGPKHAHNAILQTWLEIGLIGVIVLVFGFARATSRALTTVAIVPNAIGLWPLVYLSSVLLVSITESGPVHSLEGWMLFVIAALAVASQVKSTSPVLDPVDQVI